MTEPAVVTRERGVHRIAFFAVATAGIVTSLVLGIHAAIDTPDLQVSDARVRREGLVAAVQVTVHNESKTKNLCPTIVIAARNRDGLDIHRHVAAPTEGAGAVAPGQTVGFRADFPEMTEDDYRRLDKFVGFVDAQRPC